eukprot:COSAG02_NODE_1516_length_12182_cov_14.478689_11_plen_157_part_00
MGQQPKSHGAAQDSSVAPPRSLGRCTRIADGTDTHTRTNIAVASHSGGPQMLPAAPPTAPASRPQPPPRGRRSLRLPFVPFRTVDTHQPETCHSAFAKSHWTAIFDRIIMKLICKMISSVDYHVFGYEITMHYYTVCNSLGTLLRLVQRCTGAIHW